MDELFSIEKKIGEVSAVISLQFAEEETNFTEDKWEEFEEPVVAEKPKRAEGDEEEAEEAAPADEEGEKKPSFDPTQFKWTVTNRRAKNLP